DYVVLVGAYGSLLTNSTAQRRFADVTMRVGTPELDNTHGQSRPSGVNSGSLPLGNDADAISRLLWELTDREYQRAVPTLLNVRTNTAVRAEEEDKSPDFSKEKPQTHIEEAPTAGPFDRAAWEGEIKRLSGAFRKYPEVYFASVMIQVQRSNSRMVSSEGSAIVSPSASARLIMEAQTRAEDGMDLLRVETFQAPAASGLPSEAELAGSYDFDNEGEPARRVEVIKDGVLENFLMSRMPVKNFAQSNGHGRNQPGRMPTGRQGNLIVTSTKTVPEAEMRQKLIEEVKKQGKPYGLYFDDIQGGFTLTTRSLPQAFQVLPVLVYKV